MSRRNPIVIEEREEAFSSLSIVMPDQEARGTSTRWTKEREKKSEGVKE